jgi:hypothetical protein
VVIPERHHPAGVVVAIDAETLVAGRAWCLVHGYVTGQPELTRDVAQTA